MIRFACPGCGATYTVPDEKGGKTGKCPKCQGQFVIPNAEPTAGGAVSPPPPLAPSNDPNAPVEVAPCPGCQARLSVAESDLGADVECPYCKTIYKAVRPGAAQSAPEPAAPSKSLSAALGELGGSKKSKASSKRNDDDDEPEERPAKKKRSRDYDDEDDYEEDDRRSRRSRRSSGGGTVVIARIGVLSSAKIMMAVYFGFGAIGGIFLLGISLLGAVAGGGGGGGLVFGVVSAVAAPFLYGFGGFIGGAIGALIYNLAAGVVGGMEMDLE